LIIRKSWPVWVAIFLTLALWPASTGAAPSRQDSGQVYTIQKDDWLSKIADKEYGDVLAYTAIAYYNNLKAVEDETFVTIENPDVIEVGWTVYLPSAEEVVAFLAGEPLPISIEPNPGPNETPPALDNSLETAAAAEDALGFIEIGPDEPIHLAYMLTLSGTTAFLGAESLAAIEMALAERDQIRGHDILLSGEDAGCSDEGGRAAAARVVAEPTVVAVIGTNCFISAAAALPSLSRAGLLMVSPTNTGPALTDPSGIWEPGYFRTAHNDLFQSRLAAQFAYDELDARTAATIHDGSTYTNQLQQAFAQRFEALGGRVTYQGVVGVGQQEMGPLLTTIAADTPDLLYLPLFEPEGPLIVAQAADMPALAETVVIGADGLLVQSFAPAVGPAAEGVYLSGNYANGAAYEEFLISYEAATGTRPPAGFAAHAYDATNLVLDAIEAVAVERPQGGLMIGRQALRDTLAGVTDYAGLSGRLTCSQFGDCASGESLAIYQITAVQITAPDNWPPPVVYRLARR